MGGMNGVDRGTTADWDAILDALRNSHRRRLLVDLMEHDPQQDVGVNVPEAIQVRRADLDDLRVELYHTHLPKLEELGYIRWERGAHEVTKGPNFDEIRPLLELIEDHRDELPRGWI